MPHLSAISFANLSQTNVKADTFTVLKYVYMTLFHQQQPSVYLSFTMTCHFQIVKLTSDKQTSSVSVCD